MKVQKLPSGTRKGAGINNSGGNVLVSLRLPVEAAAVRDHRWTFQASISKRNVFATVDLNSRGPQVSHLCVDAAFYHLQVEAR